MGVEDRARRKSKSLLNLPQKDGGDKLPMTPGGLSSGDSEGIGTPTVKQRRKKTQCKLENFDEWRRAESKLLSLAGDPNQLGSLWDFLDMNGDGNVSLDECVKVVAEQHPKLCNLAPLKEAMRYAGGGRFKQTDPVSDSERIEPAEFPSLIASWLVYEKIFTAYQLELEFDTRRKM